MAPSSPGPSAAPHPGMQGPPRGHRAPTHPPTGLARPVATRLLSRTCGLRPLPNTPGLSIAPSKKGDNYQNLRGRGVR